MVIIETSVFTCLIRELIDAEDYRELQVSLVQNPDKGDLIPGSGGLRKIRYFLLMCLTTSRLPNILPGI